MAKRKKAAARKSRPAKTMKSKECCTSDMAAGEWNACALGKTVGLLSGLDMLLLAIFTGLGMDVLWYNLDSLNWAMAWFPGSGPGLIGGLIGILWGVVAGYICGYVIAWIYNKMLKCKCCMSSCCK